MILANGATVVKDSSGNVMIKDNLASNALTCDSEGNCMLKDFLKKKVASAVPVDCSSDADKAAWTAISPDFATDVSACAGLGTKYKCTSIFKMNGPCVSSCMAKTQHFSDSCSTAFGDLATCGFKNCKSACITGDPNSQSCVTCNEQKCSPAFHASTGFEITCKYFQGCNGTVAVKDNLGGLKLVRETEKARHER